MRPLRFGMVGGGKDSFIGPAHVMGAQMDGLARLVAGCFSRTAERNLESGSFYCIPQDRLYPDYVTMLQAESAREDGIDFVIIATPNYLHAPVAQAFIDARIHVSCDKPVALSLAEAKSLHKSAVEKDCLFGVSYTYANYPMVRQMQGMVEKGFIGNLVNVVALYPQDWVLADVAADKHPEKAWRFNTNFAGHSAATADIGTHLSCMVERVTGKRITRVMSEINHIPEYMPLETDVKVMFRLEGGSNGLLWASQAAIGHACDVSLMVYGDQGSLQWSHKDPGKLICTKVNQAPFTLMAGSMELFPEVRGMCRLPAGHPEGFFEAFGCYYQAFCKHIVAKKEGEPFVDRSQLSSYTDIEDGLRSLSFVEACLESAQKEHPVSL